MRFESRFFAPTIALLVLAAGSVPESAAQGIPTLTETARVSLISILPGDDVYSTFGHSAIRIADRTLGLDESYNFGTFEFGDSPTEIAGFIARFTYGDLHYRLSVQNGRRVVAFYWEELGRASIEQTLDLSPDEKQALFERLRINARPQNAYYQYDFFFDNCATRLLDVLEASVGPALSFAAPPPDRSFRQLLDLYLPGVPWTDVGMDLGLGLPADRDATAREATFLPEFLLNYLASGQIDRNGSKRPLVARTDTLTGGSGITWQPEADPPWPAIVMWVVFFAGALLTAADVRNRRGKRRVVDSIFFGLLGIGGLIVAFLWFVSLHAVTDNNLNLAWALPTHLVVAVAIARDAGRRWVGTYLAVTATLAGVLLIGFPFWSQQLPAALIPLLLLIVVRAGGLVRVRITSPAKQPSRP
ncbi:MAG: DUF4105 domain-containing protein [Gemmatimonadales bacterium]|nr:MAG: DUF4105 domain-containing protein [Gemmatimonadales bacterium]